MSNHTPGPWAFTEGVPRTIKLRRAHFMVGSLWSKRGVAIVFSDGDAGIDPANARLISQAPALLASCERLASLLAGGYSPRDIAVVAALDEAGGVIAKAMGGTP